MSDRRRFSQQRISNADHHTLTNSDNKSTEDADLQWNESKCPPPEKILKIAFAISLFIIVLGSGFIARITFHILIWHISPPIMSNDSNINTLGGMLESNCSNESDYRHERPESNCSVGNGSDCLQSDPYSAVDEIWIWAVFLVIVVPYFLTFLSTFFRICFKTNKRMDWKVLLAAIAIETIHSIGVSILAFLVLPSFDPASASVIYMAVALVPAILNVIDKVFVERLQKNNKISKCSLFDEASWLSFSFPLLGIAFQIIGIILIGLYIDRGWLSGIFVVAVLFTSVKYWENFITMGDEKSVLLRRLKRELHVGRTKVTCLANIWKIIITFLAIITIFTSKSDDPTAVFKSLFNDGNATIFSIFGEKSMGDNPICQYNVPLLAAAITIICEYLCYKATKTICAINCQRFGYAIPMIILPVATTFTLVGLMHTPDILKFETCDLLFSDWCVQGNGNLVDNCTELFAAFFLLYFSILLITRHVWKVNGYKHGETARIFVQPFYCGMLLDISLLLNRRRYDKEYDIVHKKKFENKKRKMLYACCATMWHETANEMTQLLKSLFRLDMKQFTTEMIAESAKDDDKVEPFDFEANVFFDDAFDPPKEGQSGPDVNDYVKTFIQVINEAGSAVHGKRITIPDGEMYRTPYGARIYWALPGGNKLVVHLKDKNKIRRKKRWSQVMYMFYILKWALVNQYGKAGLQEAAENTYLLALDGDVDFEPEAVLSLMKRMNKSPLVGAVCGRIHPIGSGPMVWYQKFEYAISHWLQKATEHVLGCVLCSPGCFSLFRGSAILHPDVLDTYTTDSTEAEHFIQYDQGEDRWLCTLLLKQGWKIEYCAESDAYTYAPEGFYEFYNQRRRWVPSTMINVLDVIMNWKQITYNNENLSFLYIVYHSVLFASVLLTPGTIFMLVFGAIILGFDSIPPWLSLVLNLIPVGIFLIMTLYASQQRQIQYAAILSAIYVLVMVIVLIGVLRTTIVEGFCSTATFFTIAVGGIFIISAIIHPKEILCIIPGLLYFLAIPSMSMLMFLYSIGNLHVVSWGTRESTPDTEVKKSTQKHKPEKDEKGYFCSLGDFFGCIFCPTNTYTKEDFLYTNIINKVDRIVKGEKGEEGNDETDTADGKGKNTDENSASEENVDKSTIKDKNAWDDRKFKTENDEEYNLIADRHVKAIPKNEIKFWKKYIRKYLKPIHMSPTKEKKIQDDLLDLRNRVSLFVYLLNGVLVTVMYSLTQVNVFENDLTIKFECGGRDDNKIVPIAILFAVVFGMLLSIQFICMLYHRFSTLIHVAANTDIWESEKSETTKIDEKIASRLVSAETHRSRKTAEVSDKDRTVLDMNRSIVKQKGPKFRQLSEIVEENMQKMKIDVDKMKSLEKLEGSVFQKRNSKIAERYAMKWKHHGKSFGSIVDRVLINERNKKKSDANNCIDEEKTKTTQPTPSILRKNQVDPSDKEEIKRRQSISSNDDDHIDNQRTRVEDDSNV